MTNWQDYEREKKTLPPMTPDEYVAAIREILERLEL